MGICRRLCQELGSRHDNEDPGHVEESLRRDTGGSVRFSSAMSVTHANNALRFF